MFDCSSSYIYSKNMSIRHVDMEESQLMSEQLYFHVGGENIPTAFKVLIHFTLELIL